MGLMGPSRFRFPHPMKVAGTGMGTLECAHLRGAVEQLSVRYDLVRPHAERLRKFLERIRLGLRHFAPF